MHVDYLSAMTAATVEPAPTYWLFLSFVLYGKAKCGLLVSEQLGDHKSCLVLL